MVDSVGEYSEELEDIGALKARIAKLEQALESSRREQLRAFQSFFDCLPFDLWVIDTEGKFLFQNTTSIEHWGSCLGKSPSEISLPQGLRELWERNTARVLAGEIVQQEGHRQEQEHEVPVSKILAPLKDSVGIWGALGINLDRREYQEFERRLQQTQKLESLGVLAGGIAHDFNNILQGIFGYVDLCFSRLSPMSPAGPYLKEIRESAGQAAELCQQMLAYSGRGQLSLETCDLNELIYEMEHLFEVTVSKRAILKLNTSPELPSIEGDPSQLRQVLLNLVLNASEAIGERSGIISIKTGLMDCDVDYLESTFMGAEVSPGCFAYFEVADTGCGMGKDSRRHIFDPFYTTKFTGRGLGLAAVLGIVRGHKGAIKVYSEVGQGSTFKILLPALVDTIKSNPRVEPTLANWRGEGRVLVVDDDHTVRSVARLMLENAGFEVRTARDGEEALDLLKKSSTFCCVILDLTMPRMGGEECFRRLRQKHRELPVILSSGYNEEEIHDRFIGKGLAGFLKKPYRADELYQKLSEVLGR